MGSILAMAFAQMSGARLRPMPWGREAGLVIVGITLGLHFTPPVVAEVSSYGLHFVVLGLAALGIGALSGAVLRRAADTDPATAYFSSMPGGAAEMAMLGERFGARVDQVAFAHSTRMLLVVTVVPTAITLAGFDANDEYRPVLVAFDLRGFALLLAASLAGGFLARRLHVPTAFMMGPLLVAVGLTVSGISLSSMPVSLTNAAQVLLGGSLGARFDRRFLSDAPRFVAAVIPSVLLMLGLAALAGWALALASGANPGTGLLAAAPGGIAEMSITAKVLRIGVAYVTAAHVVRYAVVVLLTISLFRLLTRK